MKRPLSLDWLLAFVVVLGVAFGTFGVASADPESDGCESRLQTFPPNLVGLNCKMDQCILWPGLHCKPDVMGNGCACIGHWQGAADCASEVTNDPIWGWMLTCLQNDCPVECTVTIKTIDDIYRSVIAWCDCPQSGG